MPGKQPSSLNTPLVQSTIKDYLSSQSEMSDTEPDLNTTVVGPTTSTALVCLLGTPTNVAQSGHQTSTPQVKRMHTDVTKSSPSPPTLSTNELVLEMRKGFASVGGEFSEVRASIEALVKNCNSTNELCKQATEQAVAAHTRVKQLDLRVSKVEHVTEGLQQAVNDLQNGCSGRKRECELLISGLTISASITKPRIHQLVRDIFAVVGEPLTDRDLHYAYVQQNRKTNATNIIVKFSTEALRDIVFASYFRKGAIYTTDIKIEPRVRIYVSDNLSPEAASVKFEARKLMKAGKIAKVSVRRGLVAVALPRNANKFVVVGTREDKYTLLQGKTPANAQDGASSSMANRLQNISLHMDTHDC